MRYWWGGVHSTALEQPTYQILASYRAKNLLKGEVRIKFPPLGKRLKFGAYDWEGWGIRFLALGKPTCLILASY